MKPNVIPNSIQEQINKTPLAKLNESVAFFEMIRDIKEKGKVVDSRLMKTLFTEYNYYFSENQTGMWCSSCRVLVYNGLRKIQPFIIEKIEEYGKI